MLNMVQFKWYSRSFVQHKELVCGSNFNVKDGEEFVNCYSLTLYQEIIKRKA